MINVQNLSDAELDELRRAVSSEQLLRRRLDASPEKIEHAIAEYQKASGKGTGEQWEQPVTALQAYRQGAEVEDDGAIWVSTHGNNTGIPGQSGWRQKPKLDDEGNEIPPPFVQPAGQHDSYDKGTRITWTDGLVYEAARDGVSHTPDEYAPDWNLIEPEPEDPEDSGEDDEDDPEEPDSEIPEWQAGVDYKQGDPVIYKGETYTLRQDHTSAAHWPPDQAHSLYKKQE